MKIASSILIATVLALATTSDARPRPSFSSTSAVNTTNTAGPTSSPYPTTGCACPSGGVTTSWTDWNNTTPTPTPTGSGSCAGTLSPTWSASTSRNSTAGPTGSPCPTDGPCPTTGGACPSGGVTTSWTNWNNTTPTPIPTGSGSCAGTLCPTWSASTSRNSTAGPTGGPCPTDGPCPTTGGACPSGGVTTSWTDWNNTAPTPTPTGSDSWTGTPRPT